MVSRFVSSNTVSALNALLMFFSGTILPFPLREGQGEGIHEIFREEPYEKKCLVRVTRLPCPGRLCDRLFGGTDRRRKLPEPVPRLYIEFTPVIMRYISRYLFAVLVTMSWGNAGPGAFLFQSSVSR